MIVQTIYSFQNMSSKETLAPHTLMSYKSFRPSVESVLLYCYTVLSEALAKYRKQEKSDSSVNFHDLR